MTRSGQLHAWIKRELSGTVYANLLTFVDNYKQIVTTLLSISLSLSLSLSFSLSLSPLFLSLSLSLSLSL